MTSIRSKLLILTLLISSIGFASPPTPQVSIDSLMNHLGIQGFRSNIIGEHDSLTVEILKVENGEITETYSTFSSFRIQTIGPVPTEYEKTIAEAVSTVDVIFEKVNRSKYKLTVIPNHNNFKVPKEFMLDWQGSDSSQYPSALIINDPPILFTGEIYEDDVSYLLRNNLISQTDLNTKPNALYDAITYLKEQGIVIPTRNEISNIKYGLMIRVIGWPAN